MEFAPFLRLYRSIFCTEPKRWREYPDREYSSEFQDAAVFPPRPAVRTKNNLLILGATTFAITNACSFCERGFRPCHGVASRIGPLPSGFSRWRRVFESERDRAR